MEKILIINLRKLGDILSTAHLIHSLKNRYPESQVSLLIYKEQIKAAKLLKHITNIHVIDRKRIVQFKKNRLYPKSYAINLIKETLDSIASTAWDHVFNFSNDEMSCLLTSYLGTNNFIGLKYNSSMQINYSNAWALFFNDVLTEYPFTPVHFNEVYHHMAGIEYIADEIKVVTDPQNNRTAYENFKKIKEKIPQKEKMKIIGIQLRSGVTEKEIPFETLVNLIQELYDHKYFYPLLLISTHPEDIDKVNQINKIL